MQKASYSLRRVPGGNAFSSILLRYQVGKTWKKYSFHTLTCQGKRNNFTIWTFWSNRTEFLLNKRSWRPATYIQLRFEELGTNMEKAATSSLTNEVPGHISVSLLFSSKWFITGSRTRAGLIKSKSVSVQEKLNCNAKLLITSGSRWSRKNRLTKKA